MSKKKKQKRRQKKKDTNAPARLRRLPAPRVSVDIPLETDPGSPEPDNPITAEIVRLHAELNRVTQRGAFQIWTDWLETTEAWLKVVGARGELGAMAELPAEVQQKFDQLDRAYSRTAAHRPAAYRQMGETFTTIHRLLADTYPFIDLEACGRIEQPNPDILGQAFVISLGCPRSWREFFPGWPACIKLARELIPADPAGEVYERLVQAHVRAQLDGAAIEAPQPGRDETWPVWFEALKPYYEPLLIGPGMVFSSTMLLVLAARFPAWIVRNGLARFVWPDITAEPVLNNLTSITAMLYGLNGFYAGKFQGDCEAIAHIEAAINEEANSAPALTSPHPAAVYRELDDHHQEGTSQEQQPSPSPTRPSFSDLFKSS